LTAHRRAEPHKELPFIQPESTFYPVRVRADLDPALSRWQWLVKWILAIPHYIALFFLHIAVVVVTVIAFFAILITGKYPRALFDFSLGVMRWRWRVAFYALLALSTDKYPLFSLQSRADYPADLEVDYPERLRRGLALIKSWLLAIPHYLILFAIFTGGWRLLRLDPNEFVAYDLPPLIVHSADNRRRWFAVLRALPKGVVRPPDWDQSVVDPSARLRLAAARRLPATTSRHRSAGGRIVDAARDVRNRGLNRFQPKVIRCTTGD
jgi:hypothetical protein